MAKALLVVKTKGRFPFLTAFADWLLVALLALNMAFRGGELWPTIALVSWIPVELLIRHILNRGKLVLGDDGVQVTGFRFSRFVPYDAIATVRVSPSKERITLELRNGDPVVVDISIAVAVATELYNRLEQTLDRATSRPVLSLQHEPGGMSAWRNRIRRLLMGRFREPTVTPELLIRVAEDPNAAADQRIGAAVALADAPEPFRARVRVAAESVARPDVGRAMEQAVDGYLDDEFAERVMKAP